jgi:hypothetical protein
MVRRLRQDEPMLIEMTTDPVRGCLQALLQIPEPPNARIELEIKLVGAGGASTERAMARVSRIIDDLRFCGVSAWSCAACARHQVNAMIRYCEGQAELSACKLSAVVRLRGEQERATIGPQLAPRVATEHLRARAAAIGG